MLLACDRHVFDAARAPDPTTTVKYARKRMRFFDVRMMLNQVARPVIYVYALVQLSVTLSSPSLLCLDFPRIQRRAEDKTHTLAWEAFSADMGEGRNEHQFRVCVLEHDRVVSIPASSTIAPHCRL